MYFNSFKYICFLPLTVAAYFLLPARARTPFLLLASYYFYMCWEPEYALLMLFSTTVTYLCGRLMARSGGIRRRRLWLVGSLVINLGILFVFKYFEFFSFNISRLASLFSVSVPAYSLGLLLPVGISFYTFQALGYTIDVYRGDVEAERNFIDYALFVSFFPQLVAGPIERTSNILPQLKERHVFSVAALRSGFLLVLWGMAKKVLIADNLAVIVTNAYNDPYAWSGAQLIFATVCFAVQIYCDFSAYTDIARGSARALGFSLMENFNCPYLARSIRDFWRRWHISLSTWFRDYLYFSLGGSRVGKLRQCVNVMVVFLISGLWHGAALTFAAWGLLHGAYQVVGILLNPLREKLYTKIDRNSLIMRLVRTVFTFALVCAAWVFFRADTMGDALYILKTMLMTPKNLSLPFMFTALGLGTESLYVLLTSVIVLAAVDFSGKKEAIAAKLNGGIFLRYAVYCVLLLCIFIFGYYGAGYDPQDFIYFQF